ncbi:MAG: hypothetical protein EU533_09020 [Promethearchaeota archaeon]|nr:MAG: hypothetical protein EU533_09020 [Candidatus Lokiarchaeota archaeon]
MTKIRICPKCKEPKLKNMMNVSGWLAPPMFECLNCGYVGSFFLEVDLDNLLSDDNQEEEKES